MSDLSSLMNRTLGDSSADLYRYLVSDAALQQIEDRLPNGMKGGALRAVSIAKSHFTKRMKTENAIRGCTCRSVIAAICEAAEYGIFLDGRLGYAVPYKDTLQFIPGYLGMIAVARRIGLIDSVWAEVVMPTDDLEMSEEDGRQTYRFQQDLNTSRDFAACRGVLSVVWSRGRMQRQWMTRDEIDAIRKRSRASGSGPWVTDTEEMAKKTGLRRILKTFADDPSLARLFSAEDAAEEFSKLMQQPVRAVTRRAAGDVFAGILGETAEAEPAQQESKGAK